MAKVKYTADDRSSEFRMMAPALRAEVVTKNDSEDNVPGNATLYVGTGGTIVGIPAGNDDADTITLENVPDGGTVECVRFRRILTSSTAADIIACW